MTSSKYLAIINAGRVWAGGLHTSPSSKATGKEDDSSPSCTVAAQKKDSVLAFGNRIVGIYHSSQILDWMKTGSTPSAPAVPSAGNCESGGSTTTTTTNLLLRDDLLPPLTLENTQVIDLEGKRFVSPGFIDAHLHFLDSGREGLQVLLNGASSKEDFQQQIVDQVKKIKKNSSSSSTPTEAQARGGEGNAEESSWIFGRGWLEADLGLPVGETPTIDWIDNLPGCEGIPLVLKRNCLHSTLVNSVVLKLCGIDKDTPDPEGGRIERFPDGRPNGILREGAMKVLKTLRPQIDTLPNLYFALEQAQKVLFEQGVTQAHHMSTIEFYTPDELRFLMKAETEGKLKIRLAAATKLSEGEEAVSLWKENQDRISKKTQEINNGDGTNKKDGDTLAANHQQTDSSLLSFGMVKCFLDGALGSKTLAMIPHDEFNSVSENTVAMAEELRRKKEREKRRTLSTDKDEFDDDDKEQNIETSSPPLSPEIKGLMMQEWPDLIKQQALFADQHGLQMCFHAIGDAAVRACIEICDHCDDQQQQKQGRGNGGGGANIGENDFTLDAKPSSSAARQEDQQQVGKSSTPMLRSNALNDDHGEQPRKDRRIRIEHCQNVAPSDRSKLAERGMIASMQPLQLIGDTQDSDCMLGVDRSAASAYAFRSLLIDNNIPLAFGSDWMVCFPSVLKSLYTAVLRKGISADGKSEETWNVDQALSPEQALLCHTYWASYAAFNEHRTGTIDAGFLADITILQEDPLTTLEALQRREDDACNDDVTVNSPIPGSGTAKDFEDHCRVIMTIVDGEIQWDGRGEAAATG